MIFEAVRGIFGCARKLMRLFFKSCGHRMWRKMWRAYRGKGRFYSQDAFPGLPLDVVVTHILGSANLPDPIDLARLRAVGRGMRVAVDVTGRKVEELEAWEAASRG